MASALPPEVLAAMQPAQADPNASQATSALGRVGEILGAGGANVYTQLRYGLPYAIGQAQGALTDDQQRGYQQAIQQNNALTARGAPVSFDDVRSGKSGLARFVGENLVGMVPQAGGMLLGGLAGGALAGPSGAVAGAVLAGAPQFAGQNASDIAASGKMLTQDQAEKSLIIAPFQAGAAEAANMLTPGLGRLVGGSEMGFTGNIVSRMAKSMLTTGASQAAAGVAMEGGSQYASGNLDPGKLVDAAVGGLAVGGFLGAFGGFKRAPIDSAPAADLDPNALAQRGVEIATGAPDTTTPLALPSPQMIADSQGNIVPASMTADHDLLLQRHASTPGAPPEPIPLRALPSPDMSQYFQDASGNWHQTHGPQEGSGPTSVVDTQGNIVTGPNAANDMLLSRNAPTAAAAPAPPVLPGLPGADATDFVNNLISRSRPDAPDAPLTAGASLSGMAGFTLPGGIDLPAAPEAPAAVVPEAAPAATPDAPAPVAPRADPLLSDADKPLYPSMDLSAHNPDGERPLAQFTDAELSKVATAKDVPDDWKANIDRERALRQGELTGAVPVADSTFQQRLTDLKEGLRGSWVTKLEADSPADLVDKVFKQIFDEQDQAVSVNKLASRMGILDPDTLKPTDWAESVLKAKDDAEQTKILKDRTDATAAPTGTPAPDAPTIEAPAPAEPAPAPEKKPSKAAQAKASKDAKAAAGAQIHSTIDSLRSTEDGPAQISSKEAAEVRNLVDDGKHDEAQKRLGEILDARDAAPEASMDEVPEPPMEGAPEKAPDTTGVAPAPDSIAEVVKDRNNTEAERAGAVDEATQRRAGDGVEPGDRPIENGIIPEDRSVAARNQIDQLHQNGAITDAQRQSLHDMLDQGRVDDAMTRAMKMLQDAGKPEPKPARSEIGEDRQPPTEEGGRGLHDEDLAQAIHGKSVSDAAQYLADNAPSRFHRKVFDAVAALARKLEGPDWQSKVHVVREGDMIPRTLHSPGISGAAHLSPVDGKVVGTAYLKHAELLHNVGTSYVIAGHELLHMVTMDALDNAKSGRVKSGDLLTAQKDLGDLLKTVTKFYDKRKAGIADGSVIEHPMESTLRRGANGLKDIHELVSWGLTHPDMQEYLQTIPYPKLKTAYGQFISAIRKLLGLKDARMDTALSELVRVSDELLHPGAENLDAYRNILNPKQGAREANADMGTPEKVEEKVGGAFKDLTDSVANIDLDTFKGKWDASKRSMLGWVSNNHLVRLYGDTVAGLSDWREAHRERATINNFMQRITAQTYVKFQQLDAAAQGRLNTLMRISTEFGVDPTKAFDQHTWLTDKALATTGVSRERIEEIHGEAVKLYNDLRRGDGAGGAVYAEMRAQSEISALQNHAEGFYSAINRDDQLQQSPLGRGESPTAQFIRTVQTSDTPAALKYWTDVVNTQMAQAKDYLLKTRGELGGMTVKQAADVNATLHPLDNLLDAGAAVKRNIEQAPYFHLGRAGERFGTAMIALGEDKYANPESQKLVSKALGDAGFGFAQMSVDNRQPRFMLRFDNEGQESAFNRLAAQLARDGHIQEDSIKSGPREVAGNFGLNAGAASLVSKLRADLEDSPLFQAREGMTKEDKQAVDAQRTAIQNMITDIYMNQQPDSSIARVMALRQTRPGYDNDMARNWFNRQRIGGQAMANMSTMGKIQDSLKAMHDHYQDTLHVDSSGNRRSDPDAALSVLREVQMREAKDPINPMAQTYGKLRGYAHSYFLGLSPAYMLTQMMQVGTNALPELAKTHGYANSFRALRAATGDATNIMRAVMKEMGPLPMSEKADALTITDAVLNNAKLTPQMREFMTHMMASGTIDIGSMSRAAQQAKIQNDPGLTSKFGKHMDMISHFAAMPALGMETYSRLIVALAARELHGDFSQGAMDYAAKSVREGMFDYQSGNTARLLGNKGVLGPATPIVTQFMSYSMQMMEKLHGEMLDAFTKARPGESAADAISRKSAARTFLIGHTAGIATLAGTLGLPFASVAAAVLEKLVNASGVNGQKDFDATASYRDFVSGVLGKDVGEVVARGLPRALGVDMSGRLGEQTLLPMTGLLTSKRSWKDAIGDEATSAVGAMPSMFGMMLQGGSQISEGNVLQGMKTFVPTAFKNGVEVYRMATQGYVDGKGNRMPITPTATAMLTQLLGYTPAVKAEYMEARQDMMERQNVMQQRAGVIKQSIVTGAMNKDAEMVQTGMARASAFDAANPGFMITPTLGRAIQKAAMERAIAIGTNSPVGTRARDVAGQQLTRYANTTER